MQENNRELGLALWILCDEFHLNPSKKAFYLYKDITGVVPDGDAVWAVNGKIHEQ